MYLSFYGLKIKPFQINTSPSFFWLGEKQNEALTIFKYGLSKMPGILLLTGDAGSGKTTLINVFLKNLGDEFIIVKIPDPDLEVIDFMNSIADALDFKTKFSNKDTFFDHFRHFLVTSFALGKKVMLVIDECQRLSPYLLIEIVNLANIESEETKLLKVLLIGQNEFDTVLRKNSSRTLHQLIAINYATAPLDQHETGEFIRHRLKLAGASRDIFSPDAISTIYGFSNGIPLRINIICDHALLLGFERENKTINGELIRECANDLRPREFFNTPQNDSPPPSAGGNNRNLWHPVPGSPKKDPVLHRGRTISIGILFIIPAFLITYFIDPRTFYKNPDKAQTPHHLPSSDSALHEISSGDTDPGTITSVPIPKVTIEDEIETSPEKEAAGENILPVVKQQQKDIVEDTVLKVANKPNPVGDLPAIAPIAPTRTAETSSSAQVVSLPATDLSTIKDESGSTDDSEIPTDTEEKLEAPTEPGQIEAPRIQNVIPLEEEVPHPAEAQHSDIVPVAKEITDTPPVPPENTVLKNDGTESKDILDKQGETKQTETKVDEATDEETQQKTQGDLVDKLSKPNEAEETRDVFEEPQEDLDPGAVIDWVLKKRLK